ncbi:MULTISPECIES: hypothetical protein [Anaerolinea]|uniref:hypothetical protein n=1 Tax=Anaerolinea TaxID=233189 RepID=UPI00261DE74E|nr:hypothetical protein [Anaerolinea thermophila]
MLKNSRSVLIFLLFLFLFLSIFMSSVLHHNFMQSDVLDYWNNSLSWKTPYHSFHVPGYPLLIALFRLVTFGLLQPVFLMTGINLISFLGSAVVLVQIFKKMGLDAQISNLGVLLFGLWPFVGLTYTVVPLADIPAIFFFLAGFLFLISKRMFFAGLFFGISLITHKAMWLFVGLIVIAYLLSSKKLAIKEFLPFFLLLGLPIGLLWALGATYHHSLTWIFSSNLQVEVSSRSHLPVLDGLIGTLLQGGEKSLIKGILLWAFAVFTFSLLVIQVQKKSVYSPYGVALILGVALLFVFLNQSEIWAAVRFSRLLVIPFVGIFASFPEWRNALLSKPWLVVMVLVGLIASQFVYAWYIARVYFG